MPQTFEEFLCVLCKANPKDHGCSFLGQIHLCCELHLVLGVTGGVNVVSPVIIKGLSQWDRSDHSCSTAWHRKEIFYFFSQFIHEVHLEMDLSSCSLLEAVMDGGNLSCVFFSLKGNLDLKCSHCGVRREGGGN